MKTTLEKIHNLYEIYRKIYHSNMDIGDKVKAFIGPIGRLLHGSFVPPVYFPGREKQYLTEFMNTFSEYISENPLSPTTFKDWLIAKFGMDENLFVEKISKDRIVFGIKGDKESTVSLVPEYADDILINVRLGDEFMGASHPMSNIIVENYNEIAGQLTYLLHKDIPLC